MKLLILSLMLAVPGGAALAAPSWKVESEKTIYYAQTPRLSVSLTPVEADETAWDMLSVSLSFPIADAQAEVRELKNANPGYTVTRAMVSGGGNYLIEIPSLGIHEFVEPKPGIEGPYFNWQYLVPRKQSEQARRAFANFATFLSVTGGLKAQVPAVEVVESVMVPGSICADLTAKGRDIYSVALALPAVEKRIQEIAREEENQKVLLEQVLRNCLEIKKSSYVHNFAFLLTLLVDEPRVDQDFKAELKRTVQSEQAIPLRYKLVKE